MASKDFLTGFNKAGGWRFGGLLDGSGYTPEGYNSDLLNKVGNAKGAIDKALEKTPVSNAAETGSIYGSRDGGGGLNREGGLAGNGTNFTDAQWATIKDMRDQINPETGEMVGFNNDFDRAAPKTGALGLMGVLSGSPLKLASMLPALQQSAKAQYDAIASFGGASNTGLLGQGFATNAWSNAVNENAAARQARQQQSAAEAAAIAAAQQAAAEEAARIAAAGSGSAGGGGNYGSWSRGDAGGWGGATGGTDGSAGFGGDRGTRGGW